MNDPEGELGTLMEPNLLPAEGARAVVDPSSRIRNLALGGMAAVSIATATVLVAMNVAPMMIGQSREGVLTALRTGCSNWHEIKLGDVMTGDSLDQCEQRCDNTPGCYQFNYAPSECGTDASFPGAMSCFLFAKGCEKVEHNCWDLYEKKNPTPSYVLNKSRIGCGNWASISMGDAKEGLNVDECSQACDKEKDCVKFGYQATYGCGEGQEHSSGQGACYLYKGHCEYQENNCWDLYDEVDPTVKKFKVSKHVTLQTDATQEQASNALKKTTTQGFGVTPSQVQVQADKARRLSDANITLANGERRLSFGMGFLIFIFDFSPNRAADLASVSRNPSVLDQFFSNLAGNLNDEGASLGDVEHGDPEVTSEPIPKGSDDIVLAKEEAENQQVQGPVPSPPFQNIAEEHPVPSSNDGPAPAPGPAPPATPGTATPTGECPAGTFQCLSPWYADGEPTGPTAADAKEWTMIQNIYRCMHDVQFNQWSTAMANDIQEWVNQIGSNLRHDKCYDKPPPAGPAGENLYWSMPSRGPDAAIAAWYDEIKDCGSPGFPGCNERTTGTVGHFTAMIWAGASKVGCAGNSQGMRGCRYKGGDTKGDDTPNFGFKDNYKRQVLAPKPDRTFESCRACVEACMDGKIQGTNTAGSPIEDGGSGNLPAPAPPAGALPAPSPQPDLAPAPPAGTTETGHEECMTGTWKCLSPWYADGEPTSADAEEHTIVQNIYRCMHDVQFNQWNNAMASGIQSWVNQIGSSLRHDKSYELSPPQGENLYWARPARGPVAAHAAWYDEIKDCGNPAFPGCNERTTGTVGHFTAMIWAGSRQVGCASNTQGMIGCRYAGGNTKGDDTPNFGFKDNYKRQVLAPKSDRTYEQCKACVEACVGGKIAGVAPPAPSPPGAPSPGGGSGPSPGGSGHGFGDFGGFPGFNGGGNGGSGGGPAPAPAPPPGPPPAPEPIANPKPVGEACPAGTWQCLSPWYIDASAPTNPQAIQHTMAQNIYRCMHDVQFNRWSQPVADDIQRWVDQIGRSMKHDDCYNKPPPAGPAGENLAWRSNGMGPDQAAAMWYEEVHNCGTFPGCKSGNKGATGHFTAMIWAGAHLVGCAINSDNMAGCRYKGGDSKGDNTPNFGFTDNYKRQVLAPKPDRTYEQCKACIEACFEVKFQENGAGGGGGGGGPDNGFGGFGGGVPQPAPQPPPGSGGFGGSGGQPNPVPAPAPGPPPAPEPPANPKPVGEACPAGMWQCLSPWYIDASAPTNPQAIQHTMVQNVYRCMHDVQFNRWSQPVADDIQRWVDQIGRNMKHDDCYNKPPPAGPAGENLAWRSNGMGPDQAAAMWYEEVHNCGSFPGCKGGNSGATGHFTAMIWAGAHLVGCAINSDNMAGCRYKGDDFKGDNTPNFGFDDNYRRQVLAPKSDRTYEQCKVCVEACFDAKIEENGGGNLGSGFGGGNGGSGGSGGNGGGGSGGFPDFGGFTWG